MFPRFAENLRFRSRKCGTFTCKYRSSRQIVLQYNSCSSQDVSTFDKHRTDGDKNGRTKPLPLAAWASIVGLLLYKKFTDKDEKIKNYCGFEKLNNLLRKHDLTDFFHMLINKQPSVIPFLAPFTMMQDLDTFSPRMCLSTSTDKSKTGISLIKNLFSMSSKSFESSPPPPEDSTRVNLLREELLKQQVRFQKEIEKLERENRELKKSLMFHEKKGIRRQIRRSLIDMYSEILDAVSDYESNYNLHEVGGSGFQLPRVVVIGDQSSGKTSVLEMIVQARIFPRGSGEMMTRSPVQVTLSEGPYHVARLRDDIREYDLTVESELEQLRKEIEKRMKSSIRDGQTVSNEVISLSVKGPGLQRMVLVDLPGVISVSFTATSGMADGTKEKIEAMCQQHMASPNAIILCVQDGSLDAERSIVTDLVNAADPKGKRSIFVLTKVDLAESKLSNPDRIKQILEGKLFPMRALGYFAVVTGRGDTEDSIRRIKEYEQTFFKTSNLFKGGALSAHQMGTMNMCMAVSHCFWQMVKEAVEQQAAAFEAKKFNLESEWKNLFPKYREMDREELFEKARGDILDKVVDLSQISAKQWDSVISKNLWKEMSDYIFNSIYLPAAQFKNPGYFNTTVDIRLRDWAEKILCKKSLEIGQKTLEEEFYKLLMPEESSPSSQVSPSDDSEVFKCLKKEIYEEIKKNRSWDSEAENNLRVFQRNTLDDRSIPDKIQWDEAISFMRTSLQEIKKKGESILEEMLGPSTWQKYFYWKSRTIDQSNRRIVKEELEKMFGTGQAHGLRLEHDELIALRKNLEARSVDVENTFIEETWQLLYQQQFIERALLTAHDCVKGFYYYRNRIQDDSVDCSEVILFWRINRLLGNISKDIRQHIMNYETQRLEKEIKQILDKISEDEGRLKSLLKGRRVELADEIKNIRHILKLLEEFILEFNKSRAHE